jgi:hypothetical protein
MSGVIDRANSSKKAISSDIIAIQKAGFQNSGVPYLPGLNLLPFSSKTLSKL